MFRQVRKVQVSILIDANQDFFFKLSRICQSKRGEFTFVDHLFTCLSHCQLACKKLQCCRFSTDLSLLQSLCHELFDILYAIMTYKSVPNFWKSFSVPFYFQPTLLILKKTS